MMTVMIVDDNASIRDMIRTMLMTKVDSFCECSDGSEALETYTLHKPDWVLMDIKMEKMDGFQATEEIISKYPDAKIVMVTQYDEPRWRKRAIEVGACEFVLKEKLFDIERILNTLTNLDHYQV